MKGRTGNLHASKSRSIKRPVTPATICFLYLKKKKNFFRKIKKSERFSSVLYFYALCAFVPSQDHFKN